LEQIIEERTKSACGLQAHHEWEGKGQAKAD
jgi:hypothetical protein